MIGGIGATGIGVKMRCVEGWGWDNQFEISIVKFIFPRRHFQGTYFHIENIFQNFDELKKIQKSSIVLIYFLENIWDITLQYFCHFKYKFYVQTCLY